MVFPSFSVAKRFTSALIGLLVSDGELALDDHPDIRQWRDPGDPRQDITVRDLLQMSSGLAWDEVYESGGDPVVMSCPTSPRAEITAWRDMIGS